MLGGVKTAPSPEEGAPGASTSGPVEVVTVDTPRTEAHKKKYYKNGKPMTLRMQVSLAAWLMANLPACAPPPAPPAAWLRAYKPAITGDHPARRSSRPLRIPPTRPSRIGTRLG